MVCTVINGLPSGGLGTDVDVNFGIFSASAGMYLSNTNFHMCIYGIHCFAVEGEDFVVSSPTTQTFIGGITGNGNLMCIGISIVDDDIYEEEQQFLVNITSVSPPSAVMMGTPSTTTVTIQDNQGGANIDKMFVIH